MIYANYQQTIFNNQRVKTAMKLYRSSIIRGWLGQVRSSLTRGSRRLFNLSRVEKTPGAREQYYAGIMVVPIRQIRGSENRFDDFEIDFNPIQSHTEDRWLNIAELRQQDVDLPAVDLIQVDDIYFVRDGHHRISVARALGQEYIDAVVRVWKMAELLPR